MKTSPPLNQPIRNSKATKSNLLDILNSNLALITNGLLSISHRNALLMTLLMLGG
jgi:hypothetical protein